MNGTEAKEKFDIFLKEKANFYFNELTTLNESILYSLLAPGKRIRPLLVMGFAQGLQGDQQMALACGMSIEMIHTYSLVHDDLPAMDNDDYRRGRLTNHKVYGEATAILAGDSLLTMAPEFLLKELRLLKVSPEKILELIELLLAASGHQGMVKGQALDMKYESEDLSHYPQERLKEILQDIHQLKTGSIISWSCLAGLYTHEDDKFILHTLPEVKMIGDKIGLLFQMVDDVLDVTSHLDSLGKTPGKDEKAGKLTYTRLLGVEGATQEARTLVRSIEEGIMKLSMAGGDWRIIKEIINSLEKKLPVS